MPEEKLMRHRPQHWCFSAKVRPSSPGTVPGSSLAVEREHGQKPHPQLGYKSFQSSCSSYYYSKDAFQRVRKILFFQDKTCSSDYTTRIRSVIYGSTVGPRTDFVLLESHSAIRAGPGFLVFSSWTTVFRVWTGKSNPVNGLS